MKKHIAHFTQTLIDNSNINHEQINTIIPILEQLDLTGRARFGNHTIFAAGIKPLFKINPKSIDVDLNTTLDLNVIRIHQTNAGYFKATFGIHVANRKDIATPHNMKTHSDKGFWI